METVTTRMKNAPEPLRPKSKINRFQIGFSVLVQICAFVVLIGIVNFLGYTHYKRWDLSRDKKFSLSDLTNRFLLNLKQPVKVVIFFSSDARTSGNEIYQDIIGLLKGYQEQAKARIEVETVDPFRNFTRARELQAKYKFAANENVVILDTTTADKKGRSKFVRTQDMIELEQRDPSSTLPPRIKAFKGEQAITSALIEITEQTQNKVYFHSGHGEPDLQGESLGPLKLVFERQNIAVDTLDFQKNPTVPKDATAVAIFGPKYDFSPEEVNALRSYWRNKGRLFIALDPDAPTPNLVAFLNEAGVIPENDRILRTINMQSAAGIPLTGIQRNVSAIFTDEHPITKRFRNVSTVLLGITQSLTIDFGKANAGNLKVVPLIQAAEGFWGETEYEPKADSPIYFDPKKDLRSPLTIALAVEKGAINDPRVQVNSGRMVVSGNSDFMKKEALTDANLDFTLAAFNWMFGRENLIGIAPKQIVTTTLNLTDEQLQRITLFALILIPAGAVVLGILAWIKRR